MLPLSAFAQGVCAAPETDPTIPPGAFNCTQALTNVSGVVSSTKPIRDQYIVVFKDSSTAPEVITDKLIKKHGLTDYTSFKHGLRGFHGKMTPGKAKQLSDEPEVAFVEQDGRVDAIEVASWGLDRVDQRSLPLDQNFNPSGTGQGIHVYIFDTGIDMQHEEFTGRIGEGFASVPGGCADDNGHGTHVSGTIGGTTFGIAKLVTIHPVRVLVNGSGATSGVITGLDWAVGHVQANGWPAVGNLSLGGPVSIALDLAICRGLAIGLQFGIAAGNASGLACSNSPARVWQAVTVGATTNTDQRASFSNYGPCLDVFAPGYGIISAKKGGGSALLSGTSMAAPHVTGGLALCKQKTPNAGAKDLAACIINSSTPDKVISAGTGSPNRLLYVGPIP